MLPLCKNCLVLIFRKSTKDNYKFLKTWHNLFIKFFYIFQIYTWICVWKKMILLRYSEILQNILMYYCNLKKSKRNCLQNNVVKCIVTNSFRIFEYARKFLKWWIFPERSKIMGKQKWNKFCINKFEIEVFRPIVNELNFKNTHLI